MGRRLFRCRAHVSALLLLFGPLGCRQIAGLSDIDLGAGGASSSAGELQLGEECTSAAACESGTCVDGVCCDSTCDGACVACAESLSGWADGTCAPIPAGSDPDDECPEATCGGGASCAPAVVWSRSFGGADCEDAAQVVWDGSDAVLALGHQSDLVFGPDIQPGDGASYDIALARLDAHGEALDSADFGGAGAQLATAMARDAAGDLFVCGELEGALAFEAAPLPTFGGTDVFLAKLDPSFQPLWSVSLGSADDDRCSALVVDSSGEVVVAGQVGPGATVAGEALPSVGGLDMLVARFGSDGAHRWSRALGSNWDDAALALQVVGQRVLLGGSVGGEADLGSGPLPHAGGEDGVLVALDVQTGAHLGSATFGSSAEDRIEALASDGGGSVIACGRFSSGLVLGDDTLAARGIDVFVAAFNQQLEPSWVRPFGGIDTNWGEHCTGLALQAGQIVMAGLFETEIDLGGGVLRARSGQDVFLAALGSMGEHRWSARFGEAGGSGWEERGIRLQLQAGGGALIAGEHAGDIDFGLGAHAPQGGGALCPQTRDGFVARFQGAIDIR